MTLTEFVAACRLILGNRSFPGDRIYRRRQYRDNKIRISAYGQSMDIDRVTSTGEHVIVVSTEGDYALPCSRWELLVEHVTRLTILDQLGAV